MGFPVPLQRWIKGPAREFVRDLLLSRRARERGIFSPVQIERLIGNELEFGRTLWGALQIEMWHRTFIDGESQVLNVRHAPHIDTVPAYQPEALVPAMFVGLDFPPGPSPSANQIPG